jgi:hypothetical protein
MFTERSRHERKYLQIPTDYATKIRLAANPDRLDPRYGTTANFILELQGEILTHRTKVEYSNIPKDEDNRQRLYSEPGILFANHPSALDLDFVINRLVDEGGQARSDFCILIDETQYPNYVAKFGPKHFFPATSENISANTTKTGRRGIIYNFSKFYFGKKER